MNLSVLALCRYSRLGASSRQRFMLYRDALRDAAVEVKIAAFFDDSYLLARYSGAPIWGLAARAYLRRIRDLLSVRRFDLLWVEKEMVPYLPAAFELRLFGDVPYIIDIDDAWFLKYRNHQSPLIRRLLGNKFERLVRNAALTIVGNDHLGDWATTSGAAAVHLMPTSVDLDRYQVRPMPDGPFTIGWIGTPMTVRYLAHIAEPLRRLCDGEAARLRVIGDAEYRLPGVASVNDAWSESTEAELISQCHVGVMPLPDTPWIHGKCGYKLIQFLAAGRTAVGSRTEANSAILGNGKAGLLASTHDEWLAALTRLRDDHRLRAQMAAEGRSLVERKYSVAATADSLARHLFKAAGRTRVEQPASTVNVATSRPALP